MKLAEHLKRIADELVMMKHQGHFDDDLRMAAPLGAIKYEVEAAVEMQKTLENEDNQI